MQSQEGCSKLPPLQFSADTSLFQLPLVLLLLKVSISMLSRET